MTFIAMQHQREPENINSAMDTCIGFPSFHHLGATTPLNDQGSLNGICCLTDSRGTS